ncbi:MAG: DUF434 domain-containing protein [Desulfurococcales archaeon]|nr:DUF434 domain-containing protein [Desulfurococcales archaeon]
MEHGRQGLEKKVIDAIKDYKYLLNRGYPQKASLDFVVSRYALSKEWRSLLLRCVHREEDAVLIRSKLRDKVGPNDRLIIDGYNTILTIVSALECRTLYLCDDGIVRDLRSAYVKDFATPLVLNALEIIREELARLRVGDVAIILDSNVSWSARHAEVIRKIISEAKVKLAKKADIEVLSTRGIACSSDYLILKRAKAIYDLAGKIILKNFKHKVEDINKYIY